MYFYNIYTEDLISKNIFNSAAFFSTNLINNGYYFVFDIPNEHLLQELLNNIKNCVRVTRKE